MIVGRSSELAEISRFVRGIERGGAALLLEGEAGIGKTTLWREGVEHARHGPLRVLACRPAHAESNLAFAALIDLIGDAVDETVLSELPPPQAAALRMALLRADTDPDSGASSERAIAVGVLAALRDLATRQPLLLAIDDLQWLDGSSGRVLGYVLHRLRDELISVLATVRVPADGDKDFHGLDRWRKDDRVEHVRVGPLSLGALHQLVRERVGLALTRPLLARLTRASGGNPFYALEIARGLKHDGVDLAGAVGALTIPPDLREVVVGRIAALPPQAREAVVAVYGLIHPTEEQIEDELRLALLPPDGLEQAVRAQALQLRAGRVELSHPLIGSAAYGELTATQRRALHGRLARLATDPEEHARHLALSTVGQDADIAARLEESAVHANARGAPEAAAELLELAVQLTPADDDTARLRRLDGAALASFIAGDSVRAVGHWEEIARMAPPGPVRAHAIWRLAEFGSSTLAGGFESVPALLQSVVDEARADRSLHADIEASLGEFLLWGSGPLAAEPHARAAMGLAERGTHPRTLAHALVTQALTDFFQGHGTPLALLERAVAIEGAGSEIAPEIQIEILPSAYLAYMHGWIADTAAEAAVQLDEKLEQAAREHDESSMPFLLWQRCEVAVSLGEFDTAASYAASCRDAVESSGRVGRRGGALYCQALVDAYRGHPDTALVLARHALELDEPRGVHYNIGYYRGLLGFVELSLDHPEGALSWLEPARSALLDEGYGEPAMFRFVPDQVEALIQMRRFEDAAEVLDPFERAANRLERTWAKAAAGRCHGLLLAATGHADAALEALAEAVGRYESIRQPFELARTQLALGIVARRARRKALANESLQAATGGFERLGTPAWAERARQELARIGIRKPPAPGLTPTERHIAELVAAGQSNPEIARQLFMSRKTVEAHLSGLYRKLDIHSRAELAARAGSLGAEPAPERQM